MNAKQKNYDDAMAAFRVVSRAHRAVADDYRARKVDDAAYLASRALLDAESAKVDAAEAALLA